MTKSGLRKLYKSVRDSISSKEKTEFDSRIFTLLTNSSIYRDADLLLIYVSFGSEADTFAVIGQALGSGKRVAVPFCSGDVMEFYELFTIDSLEIGKFGIPTVIPDKNNAVIDFAGSLCIMPALSFDKSGSRLGYGGGYYDRFLCDKDIVKVGLCYERCLSCGLPSEKHDVKADYILTENRFMKL
ncbi:MAG: 5-formyltetrahydrofolate cyclo-ligase [Clostridia bacterium]|nr:5-formyltetrahydrofolate cyclo-ligase [Clostridia bacterium]